MDPPLSICSLIAHVSEQNPNSFVLFITSSRLSTRPGPYNSSASYISEGC